MTEPNLIDPAPGLPTTAGALLKRARQAQGLHIAALSASIKVAQRKLESLEADRFDELPDATFTRALAQTVCRSLKIDAAPVLALLPPAATYRLGQLGGGINTPFRERPGRDDPQDWSRLAASPAVWGPALLLLGAVVVYFLPADLLTRVQRSGTGVDVAPRAAASAVSSVPAASAPASNDVAPVPAASVASGADAAFSAAPLAASASAPAATATAIATAPPTGGPLQLRTTAQSWVEVQDAGAQVLISRMVLAGETVQLDGAMPLRVKIGNAAGTDVVFRGQPLSLAPFTRDNVARLELK